MEFIRLFEPITIHGLTIKNRIVMPAMGLAYTDKYEFTDRHRAFYRERAEGGVGLMIIGPSAIDRVGSAPFMPGLFDDSQIEPFKKFNKELHQTTTVKLATQLFHMGRNAYSGFSGMQPIAPSPVPSVMFKETPREMTLDDIEEVKNSFAQGARRAREAGFDFVEIIACTGYLIAQFLSPLTNLRTDQYGGSLDNRMRFGLEVIRSVRRMVGDDFPVGIRVAGNDFLEGGNRNQESAEFCAAAEKAGVDAINVTGGWHETNIPQLTTDVPPGAYVYLARGIKQRVGIPVFASNRLGDPCVAERALRSGACDMVCWGRPLIADPALPEKARQGRMDEIVSCIACNQGCFDSIFLGSAVCCVLNPRAGREGELKVEKAPKSKRIFVAGGGPGGMEFALTAAQRGHQVTLFEKESVLGGQVKLAQAPPRKGELSRITESMSGRMMRAGVRIRLKKKLTAAFVKKNAPDLVVVASGAQPLKMKLPGLKRPHVVSAWDVLLDRVPHFGKNIVVVGGSATGCETAHYIAALSTPDNDTLAFLSYHNAEEPDYLAKLLHDSGRRITIIEMADRIAANAGRTSRWSLLKSLRLMGIELRPETKLLKITKNSVIVEHKGKRESIPADMVVMAVGSSPVNKLAADLEGSGIDVVVIGDAKNPRKITDAVREGFEEALRV